MMLRAIVRLWSSWWSSWRRRSSRSTPLSSSSTGRWGNIEASQPYKLVLSRQDLLMGWKAWSSSLKTSSDLGSGQMLFLQWVGRVNWKFWPPHSYICNLDGILERRTSICEHKLRKSGPMIWIKSSRSFHTRCCFEYWICPKKFANFCLQYLMEP